MFQLEDFRVGGYEITDEVFPALSQLRNLRTLIFHAITTFTFQGLYDFISNLVPADPTTGDMNNQGLVLSVMSQALESFLTLKEQKRLREAIKDRVDGGFDFVLFREMEEESIDSDSD
jgi:hypothetical protein